MPSTPAAIAFCTSWICWTRSSSFCGPCQTTSTFPRSSAACNAPAWTVFQNSCVDPLGITITRHFFDLPPDRLRRHILGLGRMHPLDDLGIIQVVGRHQKLARRDSRLDRLLLKMLDHRLHAQHPHLERTLKHDPLNLALGHRIQGRLARVEADQNRRPRRRGPRLRTRRPVAPDPGAVGPPHPAAIAAIEAVTIARQPCQVMDRLRSANRSGFIRSDRYHRWPVEPQSTNYHIFSGRPGRLRTGGTHQNQQWVHKDVNIDRAAEATNRAARRTKLR